MTGVNKLSWGVAAFLTCGSAMAAAPLPDGFDQWQVDVGTITIDVDGGDSTCPEGWTCASSDTGDGFYQRQISDGSGNDYFQTIVTDNSTVDITGNQIIEDSSFVPFGGYIDSACYSAPAGSDIYGGPFTLWETEFFPIFHASWSNQTDFTPPTVTAPADIFTTVSGHANFVDLDPAHGGLLPEVTDNQTESFDFSTSDNVMVGPLPPGRHTITWLAKDNAGNEGSAEQQVDILPTANFEVDQITREGNRQITVTTHLNGTAPQYPVLIPYSVSGTATSGAPPSLDTPYPTGDHDAVDGIITIESGTMGEAIFKVIADDFADNTPEEDETVIFTMGTPTNAVAGQKAQHTVTISENPRQLTLDFIAFQNGQFTPFITPEDGVFKVSAFAPNSDYWEDTTYDWSQSNSSLVSADCTQGSFYVDPTNLSPGMYRIHVTATTSSLSNQPTSAEWWLRVGTAPTLSNSQDSNDNGYSDLGDGFQDGDLNGIPDHLDVINIAHLIPGFWKGSYKSLQGKVLYNEHEPLNGQVGWSVSGVKEHINYPMLVATEPGHKLSAGNIHLLNYINTTNVAIDLNTLTNNSTQNDDLFVVSLDISRLAQAGGTARLVIPQAVAINDIEDNLLAVRNYTPAFGWENFLEDSNNQISSTLREGDFCPPPGSPSYQPGLTEGFECLQLTLEDGGANDADGYRNGRISFHGGVAPTNMELATPSLIDWGLRLLNQISFEQISAVETQQEQVAVSDDQQLKTEETPTSVAETEEEGGGGGGAFLLTSLLCLLRLMRSNRVRLA